ncbi:aldo/keto reductase [Alkalicoccus urumqiensis]|uniref:Aldo/keto reductase n=1 Tax=Alkalicoccus urumqiensis TaxID=1548213 RepID=A0A2P6MDB9_ALKUR|nr:aldo/keto reductase [Alkalicoccus urumqiensis]PRO64264.1 aldo/keto reductase [Alkalicoccus urumqiensis]
MTSIKDTVKLHNGVRMPKLGLGVYKAEAGDEVETAVKTALDTGYRSIDTAAFYDNEESVGNALRQTSVPRKDIFVTTKVWNDQQGYAETMKAFAESREKLGLDVIDLYLIHWPVGTLYPETWRAMEELYEDGHVRAIGVSNFKIHHLKALQKASKIKPMVNQVEFHPWLYQEDLLKYCRKEKIQLEAWSPLTRGKKLDHPVLLDIAKNHGKTPAQVIIRWDLQHDIVTIPKSVTPERICENAAVYDFELTKAEMKTLDALNEDLRFGKDPDEFSREG